MTSVITGLKLDSFFDFSDNCFDEITESLDWVNGLKEEQSVICGTAAWSCTMFYIADWIAEPINLSFLNCYLFTTSVSQNIRTKLNSFLNFLDVYSSFLFNTLAESLQLRNYSLLI